MIYLNNKQLFKSKKLKRDTWNKLLSTAINFAWTTIPTIIQIVDKDLQIYFIEFTNIDNIIYTNLQTKNHIIREMCTNEILNILEKEWFII